MPPTLTFEEQIGQVILAVWPAEGGVERLAPLVAGGRVGGVVVRPGCAGGPRELAAALNHLQRLASYPLLCAAELPSGRGALVPGAACLPGPLALGSARQADLARRCGAYLAREARALGVHLLLGPSLDVQRAPAGDGASAVDVLWRSAWRTFGENPALVAHLGAAFIEGCRAGGALAAGGQFPGRGGAEYDQDRALALLPQGRQALEKIDLLPYVEAARAGLGAVQTGHLHVSALDNLPHRLATHSSTVVEGLLRRSLGFAGLLLTDNLDAPAMGVRYNPGQAAVLAFAAGHDLLVTENPEQVYRALYEVLLHGDVPPARLQQAVGRVWQAKEDLGLWRRRFATGELPEGGEGPRLAREVAASSLVVLRGRPEALLARPLLAVTTPALRCDGSRVDHDLARLARTVLGTEMKVISVQPSLPAEAAALPSGAEEARAALLCVDLQPDSPAARGDGTCRGLVPLAEGLKRLGLPLGVVLLGNPYALPCFPMADVLLYAPGDAPACLEAALDCLVGRLQPGGKLPVTIR